MSERGEGATLGRVDREGLCERGQRAGGDGVRQLPHGQGQGDEHAGRGNCWSPALDRKGT